MSMPFYVSPEQVMKDRADYARKGIGRGRSLVALECARILFDLQSNKNQGNDYANRAENLRETGQLFERHTFHPVDFDLTTPMWTNLHD